MSTERPWLPIDDAPTYSTIEARWADGFVGEGEFIQTDVETYWSGDRDGDSDPWPIEWRPPIPTERWDMAAVVTHGTIWINADQEELAIKERWSVIRRSGNLVLVSR